MTCEMTLRENTALSSWRVEYFFTDPMVRDIHMCAS